MRTRTFTAVAAVATAGLLLAGCSKTVDAGSSPTQPSTSAATVAAKGKPAVDCSDPDLSQADWTAHCGDKPGAKADSIHKQFGQTYAWPDGVKVTVTEAKVFRGYDKSIGEEPTAGSVDYQVMVKVTNGGKTPLGLGDLSVITEGATNGGEASIEVWSKGAPRLEGRVAPGVTVVKADAESLETKFGRKIVVTVQRMSESFDLDFPEFTGSITG